MRLILLALPVLTAALPTTTSAIYNLARSIAAGAPTEANAVLKSVASSGTGCANNSASFIFQNDASSLAFDNMIVDTTMSDKSRRCIITIDLEVDKKWKYTINKATSARGYANGEGGSYKVVYTAGGKTSEINSGITPNSEGNWVVTSNSNGATSGYGGGVAQVDVSLRLVPASTKETVVAMDSVDIIFDYST